MIIWNHILRKKRNKSNQIFLLRFEEIIDILPSRQHFLIHFTTLGITALFLHHVYVYALQILALPVRPGRYAFVIIFLRLYFVLSFILNSAESFRCVFSSPPEPNNEAGWCRALMTMIAFWAPTAQRVWVFFSTFRSFPSIRSTVGAWWWWTAGRSAEGFGLWWDTAWFHVSLLAHSI